MPAIVPTYDSGPRIAWEPAPDPVLGSGYAILGESGVAECCVVYRTDAPSAVTGLATRFAQALSLAITGGPTGNTTSVSAYAEGSQPSGLTELHLGATAANLAASKFNGESPVPRTLPYYGRERRNSGGGAIITYTTTHVGFRALPADADETDESPDGLQNAIVAFLASKGIWQYWPSTPLQRTTNTLVAGTNIPSLPNLAVLEVQAMVETGKPWAGYAAWLTWPETPMRLSRRVFSGSGLGIRFTRETTVTQPGEIHLLPELAVDYYDANGSVPVSVRPYIGPIGGDENDINNRYDLADYELSDPITRLAWHPEIETEESLNFFADRLAEHFDAYPHARAAWPSTADGYENLSHAAAFLARLDNPDATGATGYRNGYFQGYALAFGNRISAVVARMAERHPRHADKAQLIILYQFTEYLYARGAGAGERVVAAPTTLGWQLSGGGTDILGGGDGSGYGALVGEDAPWVGTGASETAIPYRTFGTYDRDLSSLSRIVAVPHPRLWAKRAAYWRAVGDAAAEAAGTFAGRDPIDVLRREAAYLEGNDNIPVAFLNVEAYARGAYEAPAPVYTTPGDVTTGVDMAATASAAATWADAMTAAAMTAVFGGVSSNMATFYEQRQLGLEDLATAEGADAPYGKEIVLSDYNDGINEADVLSLARENAAEAALAAAEAAYTSEPQGVKDAVDTVRLHWDLERKWLAWSRAVQALEDDAAGTTDLSTSGARTALYNAMEAALALLDDYADYYIDTLEANNNTGGYGETVRPGSARELAAYRNDGSTEGPEVPGDAARIFGQAMAQACAQGATTGELTTRRDAITASPTGRRQAIDRFLRNIYDTSRLRAGAGTVRSDRTNVYDTKATSAGLPAGSSYLARDANGITADYALASSLGVSVNTAFQDVPHAHYIGVTTLAGDARRCLVMESGIFHYAASAVQISAGAAEFPSGFPTGGSVNISGKVRRTAVTGDYSLFLNLTLTAGGTQEVYFQLPMTANEWVEFDFDYPLPAATATAQLRFQCENQRDNGLGASPRHAAGYVDYLGCNVYDEP